MESYEINGISEERFIRIMMLARMANGMELLPMYEASEEDVEDLCPSLQLYGRMSMPKIPSSAGGIN